MSNIHDCKKFKKFNFESDTTKALVFMKLLDNNCPREDALKYCKRRICRFDTSKKFEGPVSHRIVKTATTPRGWCYPEAIKYDLGKQYDMPIIEEDKAFQKFFKENKDRMATQQQNEIKVMQQFMEDINKSCNMKYENMQDLREKVKTIRQQQEKYRNNAVDYLKYKGQRYVELFNFYKTDCKSQNNCVGFEKLFPGGVRIKQKRNDEFYIRINKQEAGDLQKKFIKLQNQGELIARLSNQTGIKEGEGLTLSNMNELKDVKDLALQFNKSQYVFNDEKKKKVNRQTSLQMFNMNRNYKLRHQQSTTETFQDKIDKIISTRMDTLTSNCTPIDNINFDSLFLMKQKAQTARDKEMRKLRQIVTNKRLSKHTQVSSFRNV